MSFVQNVPCFSILMTMFAAILSSAAGGKTARKISIGIAAAVGVMSAFLLVFLMGTGDSYAYMMGHFPAPWGNELRAGMLEAAMALLFCIIMLLSLLGGGGEAAEDVREERANFYYIMADLLLAANLALVYTNDLFTAYVFVEISTIAACGMILGKFNHLTIASAVRYMIMSLMGSGLLLLGICFFYDMTGHLLMSSIKEEIAVITGSGAYQVPFLLTVGLVSVGLAIKSALWPFHAWLPNAYGYSTVISSAMLSSIVSKGYVFLLLKIIFRIVGLEAFVRSHVTDILFLFGMTGMILGSVDAIRQNNIRRMVAYSSVAQIGYIFMGTGMGTTGGMEASVYHIFAHASAKALVFTAVSGLVRVSGGKTGLRDLSGAGFRNRAAGAGFVIGSLSMIGIPGCAGFVSKLMFAKASLEDAFYMIPVLACLAISTLLNAIYFMRVVLFLYTPDGVHIPEEAPLLKEGRDAGHGKAAGSMGAAAGTVPAGTAGENGAGTGNSLQFCIAVIGFICLNLFLGICTGPVSEAVRTGLSIFG